jgi:hypothetical protein
MTTETAEIREVRVLEIASVRVSDSSYDELIGFNIDSPASGETLDYFWLPLAGWCLPSVDRPVHIVVTHAGVPVQALPVNGSRPDLAEVFPQVVHANRCGFSAAVSVARLPEQFELAVAAGVAGSSLELATIWARRRRFEPLAAGRLAPLALTTLGRTGSTLIATLLSNHPAVVALDPAKHDSRPLAYWLEVATSLGQPSSSRRIVDSDPSGGDWWTGQQHVSNEALRRIASPVRRWLGASALERLLHFSVETAFDFVWQVARLSGQCGAQYALEKCGPTYVPRLMKELCPGAKEIFLVRDFRDMFASMSAFNKKRGYAAFGREKAASDEEFLLRLRSDAERLARSWRERRESSLLLRYEDAVRRPEDVLAQAVTYLEIDASAALMRQVVRRAGDALARAGGRHQTTADPEQSIGRWRCDLDPSLRELANETFSDLLEEFDYET